MWDLVLQSPIFLATCEINTCLKNLSLACISIRHEACAEAVKHSVIVIVTLLPHYIISCNLALIVYFSSSVEAIFDNATNLIASVSWSNVCRMMAVSADDWAFGPGGGTSSRNGGLAGGFS